MPTVAAELQSGFAPPVLEDPVIHRHVYKPAAAEVRPNAALATYRTLEAFDQGLSEVIEEVQLDDEPVPSERAITEARRSLQQLMERLVEHCWQKRLPLPKIVPTVTATGGIEIVLRWPQRPGRTAMFVDQAGENYQVIAIDHTGKASLNLSGPIRR